MELKHKLEQIFNNDYPGTDRFIADVIEHIFGNEIEEIGDDLAERKKYAEKAKNAGIKHIKYIGDLTEKNYNADNIALLDVTLDDSKNIERSRVNIQQLIRSIMDYRQHLMIVFHYEDVKDKQWRFSYAYKGDSLKDSTSAKRYTYVFGKGYRGRTAAERFQTLADSTRNNEDFEKAFSVAALSDEFFDLYRAYYDVFVEYITGEKYTDEKKLNTIISRWNWLEKDESSQFTTTFDNNAKDVRDYIKKMFGRIVFLYFLQRKGWLYDAESNADAHYMRHLFDAAGDLKNTFLDDVLELLFFYVLNTKPEQRIQEASLAHKDITILPGWEKIPFLNGGLFSQDDYDPKRCVFPAVYFDKLFDFLDSYNFTIDENDQEDAEVGIDPEMLGRIFENLLEDNKGKGAFYTPKDIVDYMCRESIIAYLQNDKFSPKGNDLIRNFIETLNIDLLDTKQRDYIEHQLLKVKICDPAIGSGAFPMGLVNLLSKIFIVLRTYKTIDQAKMKRYIMQQSIYGVDIEQGAVDIARLRFWLAMVVDENDPQPLPNLHFKIMQGNSLVESYKGLDLSSLMKPVPGRLDYISDEGRKQLRSSLAYFFNESDHELRKKRLVEIKNIVTDMAYNADSNVNLTELDSSANDQFFMWHTWFADVFENGGFDIVIGNPPYLKEGRANKAIFEAVKDSPYYQGKMDIWYMFACLGIDMLKPDGNLCFIATNNWVTSSGAKKLRQKINTDAQIIQLCDFKDYMIFKTASIQTMIMQFKKNKAAQSYQFDLRNLLGTELEDVVQLLNKEHSPTTQYLEPTYNRLEMRDRYVTFSNDDCLLDKVKNTDNAIFLSDSEVTQGIVPNPDVVNSRNIKRFSEEEISKNEIQIGNPVFIIPKKFFPNLSKQEKELLKPIFEPVDFTKYTLGSSSLDIIYLTKSNSPSESDMPNLLTHLAKYRPIMEERRENQQGRIKYYHLHWPREQSTFDYGEKILVPRKCVTPTFCHTEKEAYVMMAINVIKTGRVNMKFLSGLLNSNLISFWLKNRGKMQGLNYQLDKEPLQQIPIAVPEIEVQTLIGHLVDEIIERKSDNANASIQDLENQIDIIVYHLYDLTYDEVLIVDPQPQLSREEYESFNIDTDGQS